MKIKTFKEHSETNYFIIQYGVGGGYNDIDNYEVVIADDIDSATTQAYYKAIEQYEMYEGSGGIRSVEEIMEEDDIDDENDAYDLYNEEREGWLEYDAKPYTDESAKMHKDLHHFDNPYENEMNGK